MNLDSQYDRIQNYANNAMGIGMAMRNKRTSVQPSARLPSSGSHSGNNGFNLGGLPPAAPTSRIVLQSSRNDQKASSRENT